MIYCLAGVSVYLVCSWIFWAGLARRTGQAERLHMEQVTQNLLEIYVGMTVDQAQALISIAQGGAVHPNTRAAMRWAELIDELYQLTPYGQETLERAQSILESRYMPPASNLKPWVVEAIRAMDLRKYYRHQAVKAALLTTGQLKAIRSVVHTPGQAYCHLRGWAGERTLLLLMQGGYITRKRAKNKAQVWPTAKAQALMLVLLGLPTDG